VHQAYAKTKVKCWEECKHERSGPEHREERRSCMKEKCYGPALAEDRARATEAGIEYRQMHTPLLMKAVYGKKSPKFVVMLRDPLQRCG
jgi:hypothetical protein